MPVNFACELTIVCLVILRSLEALLKMLKSTMYPLVKLGSRLRIQLEVTFVSSLLNLQTLELSVILEVSLPILLENILNLLCVVWWERAFQYFWRVQFLQNTTKNLTKIQNVQCNQVLGVSAGYYERSLWTFLFQYELVFALFLGKCWEKVYEC